MGKVETTKIIIINKNDPPTIMTSDGPTKTKEPMHLNEEMVLVFDENGNVIGNMGHKEVNKQF